MSIAIGYLVALALMMAWFNGLPRDEERPIETIAEPEPLVKAQTVSAGETPTADYIIERIEQIRTAALAMDGTLPVYTLDDVEQLIRNIDEMRRIGTSR